VLQIVRIYSICKQQRRSAVLPAHMFTQCRDVAYCNCLMREVYRHVHKKSVYAPQRIQCRHSIDSRSMLFRKIFVLGSYISCGQNVEILMLKLVYIVSTVPEGTTFFQ
jgi:hypothetical protein